MDHGEQALVHLCQHEHDRYLRGEASGSAHRVLRDASGLTLYLCDDCVRRFALEECEALGLDEIERIGDHLAAVCGECFERGHPPL